MISEVTVTDLHHPLHGERLKLLSLTCARGTGFIAVGLADGRRRLVRRVVTDLDHSAMAEPEVPRISARTLLPLARLIRRMLAASREETSHAEPTASSPLSPQLLDAAAPGAPAMPATMAGADVPGPDPTGAAGRPTDSASAPDRGGAPC